MMVESSNALKIAASTTMKVLAVVDGTQNTNFVLAHLIQLHNSCGPIEVILLNVQPVPAEWRLRGYQSFKREEVIRRLIDDVGTKITGSAGRRLASAGITYQHRIELGHLTSTILRCAQEDTVDVIVLGESPPALLRRWAMTALGVAVGSAASVIVHLAPTPVLVVKGPSAPEMKIK
jgi:nucleotide-binding universal stress UspA family protein